MMRYGKFATGISHGFFYLRIACQTTRWWTLVLVVTSLKGMATFLFWKKNHGNEIISDQDTRGEISLHWASTWCMVLGHDCCTLVICDHIIVGCGPANLLLACVVLMFRQLRFRYTEQSHLVEFRLFESHYPDRRLQWIGSVLSIATGNQLQLIVLLERCS